MEGWPVEVNVADTASEANGSRASITLLIPRMKHGGAERAVSRLHSVLQEWYDVQVVVFDDSDAGYNMKSNVTSLHLPAKSTRVAARALQAMRRAHRYRNYKRAHDTQLTYSFGTTANLVSVLSMGTDVKVVSLRGFKSLWIGKPGFLNRLIRMGLELIMARADHVLTVSQEMREALLRNYRVSPSKVSALHNGYPLEHIQRDARRDPLPSAVANEDYIVAVGTLRSVKRFDHLMRAFSASSASAHVNLVLVGSDPFNLSSQLQRLAESLNIGEKVRILTFLDNPFPLMMGARAFVLSSESEGFPNVVVEALTTGVPVISTDCHSGPREILAPETDLETHTQCVERAEYGVLVPPPDTDFDCTRTSLSASELALAEGLDELLKDPELATRLRLRGPERAADFGEAGWGRKHQQLFSLMLEENQARKKPGLA